MSIERSLVPTSDDASGNVTAESPAATGGGFLPTTLLGLVALASDAVAELARRSGAPVPAGGGTRLRHVAVGASVDVWDRSAPVRRVLRRVASVPASVIAAPAARRIDDWRRVGGDIEDAARASAARTLDVAVTSVVGMVLDRIDLTDVAMRRIDLDVIIQRVDIDSIVDRIDLNDIAQHKLDLRPIIDDVLAEVDYGEVVQSATRGVTGGTVGQMRRRAARYDGVIDRVLGRTKPGELVLPPRVVDPDALVDAETEEGLIP